MSNPVRIEIKQEQEVLIVDGNLYTEFEPRIAVYISCDSISGWLGEIDSFKSLMELVGPNNLQDTINSTLSENELDIINAALYYNNYKYTIGGKTYIMEVITND